MAGKTKFATGIRRAWSIGKKHSGHSSGGVRAVWYERSCPSCGAVTRGSIGKIRACAGGGPDEARNTSARPGCGRRF